MKITDLLQNGIPVSPSLNPALEKEHFLPQSTENKRRILMVSLVAFFISIVVSFIAKFLVLLIDLITNVAFYGNFSLAHASPANHIPGIFVIIIPVLGGLIVGVMAFYGSKAIRGHGIPEAMEQILTNQSRIKPAITFLKPLSSAIAIGTGGPFGAEGPIIATGGALGSTIGQLIKISHYERKILLAAGATAGMSAIFGTPLAAVFLAIELLLFEFSSRSILPVAIACITGAVGHHLLFENGPVFPMPDMAPSGNIALAAYTVMGIVMGVLSAGVSRAVYLIEEAFERLPVHWMWWPAIGGVAVGITGYFVPHTLGVGYDNIINLLSGNLPMTFILLLCVCKFISWAIALGSGTSGGTLAPLLTIGGAAGALMGIFVNTYFPQAAVSLPLAALAGMASMFAGASRALLTSIVFALEATMQSNALLPLLGACLAAYLVSYFLMEHNIMTEKIARRGVKTPHVYEPDILERFRVKDVFERNLAVVSSTMSIARVQERFLSGNESGIGYFIIVDDNGLFQGVVNSLELANDHNAGMAVGSLPLQQAWFIGQNDSLRAAVEIMASKDAALLIVESETGKSVAGILEYRHVIQIYKHRLDENDKKKSPAISLKRNALKIMIAGKKIFMRP